VRGVRRKEVKEKKRRGELEYKELEKRDREGQKGRKNKGVLI